MENKIALITGGSRGIGRAIAVELARHGAHIAVAYHHGQREAYQVVADIASGGSTAVSIAADISQVAHVERLFDQVVEHFGGLDILVNNAGVMVNRAIAEVEEEEFGQMFDVNVKGLFFCCRQAARLMRDGGRIINIGTTVTKLMLPNYGVYAATKGAVEQITRVLARELGERMITVNTVSPGPTDTELFRRGKSRERIDAMAAMSPFNRLGRPEDIARVVAMLCSDDSAWISGQTIFANGALAG
ncbi:MAG: SDR family oxidoreductase [Desulfofustis sp. PB-SRB1]|jgi:3-oxoacyl-[acyl-carrier protein] reductase|nr:SDR family oxidoreductase [Desulfofustis sp. PB-SRB1]MBM1002559.1 SDR family oxidoreductase [Desulfofustis sp. PB-SRB1]HBH27662.1 SDR family oxidoreductase [Desulfofustis sp.]HBH30646.1 SDR family oxidoreductase [Desulfofustis sp.]